MRPGPRADTDVPNEIGTEAEHRPLARARRRRYAVAMLTQVVAFLGMLASLLAVEEPPYAPLVGAAAITVWYAGLLPALVGVILTMGLTYVLFVGDPYSIDMGDREGLVRWWSSLLAVLVVVWVSEALRRGRDRAGFAAETAEASVRRMTAVQELAAGLAAALTPSDVAQALLTRTPPLLGARGGALGLVEGDELVIVGPQGSVRPTHAPGLRMALATRAPIAQAVRRGAPILVRDRSTFEREYPDGAAMSVFAHGALAVPVRAGDTVVGAMSFLFGREALIHADAEAIALIAADLGGQALERSRLYSRERESRQALDRILRVAPMFHADSPEEAAVAICDEARRTFGSDFAMLWRLDGSEIVLRRASPSTDELPIGLVAELGQFPELQASVEQMRVSFVADVQQEATGAGLERARGLGIRSSLRTPIATGRGAADLVLIVSWKRVIDNPDTSTYALARRFADQAGLALEQTERRRAEQTASARADETRRLQEITSALSVAATATDVSDTCLEHALAAVGADAGFVVLARPNGVTVDVVSSTGYGEDELASWAVSALDSDVPFARAIASGEAVWALSETEMGSFADGPATVDRGWASLPLRTPAGVRGALHLSFRSPKELTEGERRWLQTVVSQCALALERSRLFDVEQVLRTRSERLQHLTAALSNAVTRADVAEVVVREVRAAVGADASALAVPADERGLLKPLAWQGVDEDVAQRLFDSQPDSTTPAMRALRRKVSAFYAARGDLRSEFPDADDFLVDDHSSALFVPLVAGRRSNGLLLLSWKEPYVLTSDERRFVEGLAGQAAQVLDRAATYETEQTIAETLQRSVLPMSLPRVEGVELAARYVPGTAELDVGGDWFDAIPMADGRLGLVVGDVVGKGVHAAATMAQLRNALRAFSLDRMKPSSTMARLNRLTEESLDTTFATVVYAVLDPVARVCRITSAGHPPPLVIYPDRTVRLVEGGRGLPLGAGSESRYGQELLELPVGTTLLFYTDGLVERRGRPIDEGLTELQRIAEDVAGAPDQLVEHVLDRLVGDRERGDDIALLAVRVLAVAPQPLRLRVRSDLDSLPLVRDVFRAWIGGAGLEREDAHDLVLAVWEACANAVEHAADPKQQHVDVRADISDSRIQITVVDTGTWVAPSQRADRGLGLRLIDEMMSSVDIESDEEGTRITFEKVLERSVES